MTTQLEVNRKKAVDILLREADNQSPIPFDYQLDDCLRELHDLPPRPDGQKPYVGWMVEGKEPEPSQGDISSQGLNFIKKWEGCRLKAYRCSANVWTIGWGHTKSVTPGMTITQLGADQLLDQDLEKYIKAVRNYVKVSLNQNQFDALTSFCFNVGIGAFQNSTLLRVLNQGNYQKAANQFLRWNQAGGKVIQGLVNRRKAEKELFES